MTSQSPPDSPQAFEGGFNLTRVFVIMALMTAAASLYAKQTEPETLQVSRAVDVLRRASAAVQQQAVQAQPAASTAGDERVQALQGSGATHRVQVTHGGASAEVLGNYRPSVGTPGDWRDLPRLTDEARARLATLSPERRTVVSGDAHLRGRVRGLVVVLPGSRLMLHDVLLEGSIVSARALEDGPSGGGAPEVHAVGSVRIAPGDELPGVAILLPDGVVSSRASSSVQIHGDLVAHELDLPGSGSLFGNVASVKEPLFGERLANMADMRPGETPWADDLSLPFLEPEVLAFAEERVGWDDVAEMTRFRFPEPNR